MDASPVDLLILVLSVVFFYEAPQVVLYAFLATAPYIGGNYILGYELPINPSRPLGYALIVLMVLRGRFVRLDRSLLRLLVLMMLLLVVRTAIGLATLPNEGLDMWTQQPPTRAVRSLLSEALFWFLPVAAICAVSNGRLVQKAIRVGVWSGVFYSALGLLQFVVSIFGGVDIFPITRLSATKEIVGEAAAAPGIEGRITSICGEPRYFAAYVAIWLLIVVFFAPGLKLRGVKRMLCSCLFCACIVFSGARTGLFVSVLAGTAALVAGAHYKRLKPSALIVLVAGLASFFMIYSYIPNASLFQRVSFQEGYYNRGITVGPVFLPVEYQEFALLNTFVQRPWAHVVGFGAGLWQYFSDVGSDPQVREAFLLESRTMTSMRSNTRLLDIYAATGLIGLALVYQVYRQVFKNLCPSSATALKAEGRFAFWVWIVLTVVVRHAETYAQVLLFLFLVALKYQAATRSRLVTTASHGAHLWKAGEAQGTQTAVPIAGTVEPRSVL